MKLRNTVLTETVTSKIDRDLRVSLCWITEAKAKINFWYFAFVGKYGLLLGLVRAQNVHYESKCERKSEECICVSITKTKARKSPKIFICNHICADGS